MGESLPSEVGLPIREGQGVAWPRGSGEPAGSGLEDRQDEAYAPVTAVQRTADAEEEPFITGVMEAFAAQGYLGSGATRRHVVASEGKAN